MNTWSKIGKMIDTEEQVNSHYRIGSKSRTNRECLIGRIIAILIEEKNGITAAMMAERLGVSKSMINSIVYKMEEFDICKKAPGLNWVLV